MRTGYIYALVDPRTGLVRYVGQTIMEPKARLSNHLSMPGNPSMREWIGELKALGLRPEIDILERPPVDNLNSRERYWMVVMASRLQPLCNPFDYKMLEAWTKAERSL